MNNLKDQKEIEKIRYTYEAHEITRTEQLKRLDGKVKRPAEVFAYVFGTVSALVFGTGMCLAMDAIGESLHPAVGIGIGIVGMAMCAVNYFIYKAILKKRKARYSEQVLKLCDKALNGGAQ